MKKILIYILAILSAVACNMDFYRTDTMTSGQMKENPGAAVYTTDGNYSMFKDIPMYKGSMMGGNTYDRLYFLMAEARGDNTCLSGRTTDPIFESTTYTDDPYVRNSSGFWYISYKIIYGANAVIESLKEGQSVETDHLIGENYFIRALCHMNLMTVFSTPYTRGADKPSIVLRVSTDCAVTERATVGQVYEQVVADLLKAMQLMKGGQRRGNAGYASYDSARALLVRAYLHMEKNQEAVALATEMLGSDPAAHLDTDLAHYFANTRTSDETLWCIGKLETDDNYTQKAQLGSLYYSNDAIGGTGWCEVYYSDPLVELFSRYPEDLRYRSYCHIFDPIEGKKMIYWPFDDGVNAFRTNAMASDVTANGDGSYTFQYDGKNFTAKMKMTASYPVWYVEGLMSDEKDKDDVVGATRVYVRQAVRGTGIRDSYPAYAMSKFAWQDGDPMLASPAMLRWAEVILNRAEAYAKSGEEAKALSDVNVIRKRAGLPDEAMMTLENYKSRGYDEVLDVVLDERRMELCFEGFRATDLYRNGRSIDRRYAGMQNWEILSPEQLDGKFPHYFPYDETSVSGITQSK